MNRLLAFANWWLQGAVNQGDADVLVMRFEMQETLTAEQVLAEVDLLLHRLSGDDREEARRLLLRRLKHPEAVGLGGGSLSDPPTPPHIEPESRIHPRSTGRNYANSVKTEPICVCGSPRSSHDMDGQRWDCDGYVEAK